MRTSNIWLFYARQFGASVHRHIIRDASGLSSAVSHIPGAETLSVLPEVMRSYIEEKVALCMPAKIHVIQGTPEEDKAMYKYLEEMGVVQRVRTMENCWVTRTDPADVARVESRTVIASANKYDTVPHSAPGVQCTLGNWISPADLDTKLQERFPGCMKGHTMYVIPFSMGPLGSFLSKIGVELTDSPYVAASMRIMTRAGSHVLNQVLQDSRQTDTFIKCLHSVGRPLPWAKPPVQMWPCDPQRTLISHIPDNNEIASFGSGYGGNSLLGKKCFALRLGSILARNEGWLAEHMLILGITNPKGRKRYVAAAFPSACGKTNMAMMQSALPDYKVTCVGDDIAWMRFDDQGRLRAINPEYGFFGVVPGTSWDTNPNAMRTIQRNTLFTNVATTADGGVYWEGMGDTPREGAVDWQGNSWTPDSKVPSSHPNSRFCTPASQCPIMDDDWESPNGVPIDAIIFGGRRPEGVPLVYEAFSWQHGVFIGSSLRSETTAAAEHKGKVIMHDPFAMRPFFGYNCGNYFKHWLSLGLSHQKMPKIFHVNWFRKCPTTGKFLWPGFGENVRVLDWMLRRLDGEECATTSPIGYIPTPDSLDLDGLEEVDTRQLFSVPRDFWLDEVAALHRYYSEQIGSDFPQELWSELDSLKERLEHCNK